MKNIFIDTNVIIDFLGNRTKGSKNKVGLQEAYEDRDKKGFKKSSLPVMDVEQALRVCLQ